MALQEITYQWDDRFGPCYDCGAPAAYELLDANRERITGFSKEYRRCAVCVAQAVVVDGENAMYLFGDETTMLAPLEDDTPNH